MYTVEVGVFMAGGKREKKKKKKGAAEKALIFQIENYRKQYFNYHRTEATSLAYPEKGQNGSDTSLKEKYPQA